MSEKLDRAGAVASTLCAIHCAICALLPAAFGALGLGFLLGHEVELLLTGIAMVFALVALVIGFRSHGSVRVAVLLALGIVGLLASRGLEMGSDHHGHHGEEHHAEAEHHDGEDHKGDDHKDEEHKDGDHAAAEKKAEHGEHHDEEGEEHDDTMHLIGAGVGVLGGILLLFGHIANIRASRRRKEQGGD